MKKQIMTLCGIVGFAAICPAEAAKNHLQHNDSNISVKANLGLLGGESKEYVYDADSGQKNSELSWKIKNTAIVKGDISWDALNWLTLNARGWTTLSSHGSEMNDYDWLDSEQSHWTDWSHHPDTHLNYANEFDVNLKGWVLNEPNYRLGGVIGYQQTRFSWTAFGGYYQYDNGNDVGNFPDGERGVGYQQRFSLPYVGMAGMYRYQDFEFNALLKLSRWVQANDNDEHYTRALTFREKTHNSRYYSVTVDAGYYITPNAKVFTELSLSRFSEGKGGSQLIDHIDGTSDYTSGDAGGIENKNHSITAGIQYRF